MALRSSVGQGGVNRADDTRYVQNLLNQQRGTAYNYGTITVDGLVGPQTIGAIMNYQARVVGFANPDGRVDPGYQTIAALEKNAGKSATNPTNGSAKPSVKVERPKSILIEVRHGNIRPPKSGANIYESWIIVQGPELGMFRGSIYPDDMNNYGRIQDGRYIFQIGFHSRKNKPIPTQADLAVRTGGFRAALIIQSDTRVPIISDNPGIRSSGNLHIHNGCSFTRESKGCITIQPSDWPEFITAFLSLYPDVKDWYVGDKNSVTSYSGVHAGTLSVQP